MNGLADALHGISAHGITLLNPCIYQGLQRVDILPIKRNSYRIGRPSDTVGGLFFGCGHGAASPRPSPFGGGRYEIQSFAVMCVFHGFTILVTVTENRCFLLGVSGGFIPLNQLTEGETRSVPSVYAGLEHKKTIRHRGILAIFCADILVTVTDNISMGVCTAALALGCWRGSGADELRPSLAQRDR